MRLPPYHWWRTVFYLIPAITIYTIVLQTTAGKMIFGRYSEAGAAPQAVAPVVRTVSPAAQQS